MNVGIWRSDQEGTLDLTRVFHLTCSYYKCCSESVKGDTFVFFLRQPVVQHPWLEAVIIFKYFSNGPLNKRKGAIVLTYNFQNKALNTTLQSTQGYVWMTRGPSQLLHSCRPQVAQTSIATCDNTVLYNWRGLEALFSCCIVDFSYSCWLAPTTVKDKT